MCSATTTRTRVFIVEDSVPIRERLQGQMNDIEGVAVVGTADTPKSAAEAILRTRPDAVILDLNLIGGSGLEVMRLVHPQAPEITFIVFTNHPDAQYRRASVAAGASWFLDKSHDFGKLNEVIAGLGAAQHERRASV